MEEAAAVRRAAQDAVGDVEPAPLREAIQHRLAEGSMVPGVVTVLAVGALADGSPTVDAEGALSDPIAERAAGVQLIYDGLRLTRLLAHDQPWAPDVATNGHAAPPFDATAIGAAAGTVVADAADLAILAADVLVARGFYLLARTEAAADAVGVVRAFGRDQTVRRETDDPALDANLEADVLELAVVAGASLAGSSPSPRLREYAASLAADAFPPAATFVAEADVDALATLAADSGAEGVPTVGDR